MITQACEIIDSLDVPIERSTGTPDDDLRPLTFVWATTVHPDLLRWYRDAAQNTQIRCRGLRHDEGIEEAQGIEHLALRDLALFTQAIDTHQSLPAGMQQQIQATASADYVCEVPLAPFRLVAAVPGVALLAWDQAWRDAIQQFSDTAGDVTQDPAVIDHLNSRIDHLEESVDLMMNRFVAISAVTKLSDSHRRA